VLSALEQHGQIRKSYLGLSMQPVRLPDDVQKATGEEIGLLVVGLEKGGPADKAGIAYGDTILHLGDANVKTLEDLYAYIRADHVGETVAAKVYRNGKVDTVQITLGARP
jgi:serine protease Do